MSSSSFLGLATARLGPSPVPRTERAPLRMTAEPSNLLTILSSTVRLLIGGR